MKIKLGIAKQYATSQLKAHVEEVRKRFDQQTLGLAPGFEMLKAFDALNLKLGEGLWQTGSHAKPITDESHWTRVQLHP